MLSSKLVYFSQFIGLIIMVGPQTFSAQQPPWQFHHVDFFANATRREANFEEQYAVAKYVIKDQDGKTTDRHCTSFFVKNEQNRMYLATARHCAGYKFTEACEGNRIQLQFQDEKETVAGRCTAIIAGSMQDDLIVFEASFSKDISTLIKPLTLTYRVPPPGMRLKMIGFPKDKFRQGRLTVTENCWLNSGLRLLQKADMNAEALAEQAAKRQSSEVSRLESKLKNKFLYSNCSVYGGNSGGPILIEQTEYVIGLPASFWRGYYPTLSPEVSMEIESTDGFVRHNLKALKDAGVVLVDLDSALSI